jgi:hypothetical protein
MMRILRWWAVLVLLAGLLFPAGSYAWPFGLFQHVPPDCPPGEYSPLHYWAPTLWKWHVKHHGVPGEPVPLYAEDYEHIGPQSYLFIPYHCPSAPPDGLSDYGRALPMIHRVIVESEVSKTPQTKEQTLPGPRTVNPQNQQE